MISVSYNKTSNRLNLLCSSSIAGELLECLFKYGVSSTSMPDGKLLIGASMRYINEINKELVKFKKYIVIEDSFVEWKNNNIKKKPILIKVGVVHSFIYPSLDFNVPHEDIEKVCRYFFKPAVNQKSYKDNRWDGYIYLYEKRKRRFLTGLLEDVKGVLDKLKIPYQIQYMYNDSPEREFDWKPKELFTLSDDQIECIEACIEAKRCTIKAATGFGKTSAIARYVTAYRGVPTLFVANKKVLLDDAAEDFTNGIDGLEADEVAQIKNGWFGSINLRKTDSYTEKDLWNALKDKKVIVATIQSLNTRLEDLRTRGPLLAWLKNNCKLLMVDETQAVGSKTWDTVLSCIEAPYRVFLSATPRRVDGATLKIFAYSGPLAYDTSASRQIEQGRLCDLDIQYWPFDHKVYNDNDTELNYIETYNNFIVNNDQRNKFIVERTLEMLDEERQVLVLIQFIEHGHILKGLFLEKGIEFNEIEFVYGETTDKQRKEIIDKFRKGEFKILIGSTVADAGLNIPSISGVVLSGAGNSDITHIQRIGRGSRTFDYNKNWGVEPKFLKDNNGVKVTRVVDILDNNIAFFKKQAKNRYYNACEEFGADRVKIVGADRTIFRHRTKKVENLKDIEEQSKLNDMFSVFKNIDSPKTTNETKSKDELFSDFMNEVLKYK